MITWMLFAYVFLGSGASENAIFLRDASRASSWRTVIEQSGRFRILWLPVGLLWILLGILYVKNILFFFVPPLLIFTLALALTLGPIIVEERTKSRWEFLLAVPYDTNAILLGKASGALWHIRVLTYTIGILLMSAAAVIGITSLTLIPVDTIQSGGWHDVILYAAMFAVPVLGSLLFLFDRIQYYALLAVAALASGTAARSIRAAMLTSIVAVLSIWLAEIVVVETLLTLERGETWRLNFTSILSAATLGPMASYMSRIDLGYAVLFIIGTLLLRELLLAALWRWTLRSARNRSGIGAVN
ncbi:MAG TPA: hypothetical protein PKD09_17745 [Aggregatilinea sp.]|uniref:hypothetical protein n=1 Tax=Aggregatilinea sp. TaxID=2806333 RepID=UPI002C4BB8F0|nr:hypothetical protein [Aggregatilinea sp.]HML23504.1 hypothetical protein [Aggregatilinea sp.]